MHSNIFLVRDCIEDEDNVYFLDEDSVYTFADYFTECSKKEAKMGKESLNRPGITINDNILKITDKKVYFEKKYEDFKNTLHKVLKWSFEDFINNKVDLFELSHCYNKKFSLYIQYQNYLYTLDEFMRNFNDGDVFEITDVYNYHC